MARLLKTRVKVKASKPEAAGLAATRVRLRGQLSLVAAADFWQLHKYTVKEYVDKGLIQTISIGTRRYVDEPELARVQNLLREYGSLAKAWKEIQKHEHLEALRRTLFGD